MIITKHLGRQPYSPIWNKMKSFTLERDGETPDELWLLEHDPVYTQGQAGKSEHILNPKNIPIVQSDRGGQVTYHGPGQLVGYVLMDISRKKIGIRTLVKFLENILIETLNHYNIDAHLKCGAPGVYVNGAKIASIGLRVKNGRTYHGIALNINMDLSPFLGINPCGYEQLEMCQLADFKPDIRLLEVSKLYEKKFVETFIGSVENSS